MNSSLPVWLVVAAVLSGGLWAGWLGYRHMAGAASPVDRVETVLLDLRILVTGPRAAPPDVVIVAIDDRTVASAGRYPIDRNRLARLLDKIQEAGARAVAIDILLVGATNEAADSNLVVSLGAIPTVIAGAGQFPEESWHAPFVPAPNDVLRPSPIFADVASVGLVNVSTDAGGTPRQIPLLFKVGENLEPSLTLRAVSLYLGMPPTLTSNGVRLEERVQAADLGWHLPLNYYGPRGAIKTVSAQTVLDGSGPNADIDGRLVMLGVTATGVGDRFGTPFDQILPGVEVLATGIANILDGSALVRDPVIRRIDAAAAVLITLSGMTAVALLPLATASISFLLLLFGWLVAITLSLAQGYWLSGALPMAASLPPVLGFVIIRQVFDRYQMHQLAMAQEALSRFQAPALVKRIAEDPSFLREPKEQDAAILFIDLAGYTGLSECLGPARTRDILKAFHTLVVNESGKNHGLVMDFMGDGAMIGFGIPDAGPEDATNAVAGAFRLVQAVRDWIAILEPDADISGVRVGAHFGPVVLSRLGHDNQQQIAATGDCVNVASRLLEVGKAHDASLVLSSELFAAAGLTKGNATAPQRLETVAIRGRQKSMQVALWTGPEVAADR